MNAVATQQRDYPVISQLEWKDQQAISPYLVECHYEDGDIILRQGQVSDQFHIILSGQLDVWVEQDVQVHVAQLERGQCIGEMSCLTGENVSATVKAAGVARTLSLPREGLFLLMDRSASFRKYMFDVMIQRVGKSNERVVEERTRNVVVLRQMEQEQQNRYGKLVGNSLFMRQLRQEIAMLANQEFPVCMIGEKGTGKAHVASELHYQSERRTQPLLKIDGAQFKSESWAMTLRAAKGGTLIIEHADQLQVGQLHQLLNNASKTRIVMTAQNQPVVNTHTIQLIPLRDRTEDMDELVYDFLAMAGAVNPQEIISVEALRVLHQFPFLKENIRELKRVVQEALVLSGGRTIRISHLRFGRVREPGTPPKIGLALGSGSVRGAAHVGVIKVLEEAGIPIDLIAGTSVGAFIGALYAGGQPISAFERVLPTVRWRQLTHFRLSTGGFMDNRLMSRFVEKYIGPVNFEDLPIPFAAVASDAVTGDAYILNKGRVSQAICASTAIPGIMKPVEYENRLLADGGVVHPVPAALARSMGADIVIAVNVSIPPSGKKASKNIISSILNTIEMMSDRIIQEELQLADIVLHPQLESSQITFKASPVYIQAGEAVTRDALTSIQEAIAAQTS